MEKRKKSRITDLRTLSDPEKILWKQFINKRKILKETEQELYYQVLLFLGSFVREPFLNTDWDKGFLWGSYKTALDLGVIDFPPEWEEKDPIRELTRFNRSVLVTREENLGLLSGVSSKRREYESEFIARPIMQAEFEETKERHIEKGDEVTFEFISSDSAFLKVGDSVYQWQIEDLV